MVSTTSQFSNSNWTASFTTTEVSSKIEKPTYFLKVIKDEDERFVVTCLNLKGVISDGKDEQEALKNGIEALEAMLEACNMDKDYNIIEKYY